MSAPQGYRDPPTPVEHPRNHGHHDPSTDAPASPSTPTKIPRTRIGELWVAAVAFAVVLLVLLIFVLENGQRAEVSFFDTHGHLPMGVALLLAAVFGILLVALPGTARIVQLRLLDRRRRRNPEATPAPLDDPAPSYDTDGQLP